MLWKGGCSLNRERNRQRVEERGEGRSLCVGCCVRREGRSLVASSQPLAPDRDPVA